MSNKTVFKIPVSWESFGVVEIEAESLKEAIGIFDNTIEDLPLPDAEYIDGSFRREADDEFILLYNERPIHSQYEGGIVSEE